MALSGSYYSYPTGSFGLYCEWSGEQNKAGNYTDVTQKIYLSYYRISVGERNDSISVIGESSKTFTARSINDLTSTSYKKVLLFQDTVRVTHDASGEKKNLLLSASWRFDGTYNSVYVGTIVASTRVDLDTINAAPPVITVGVYPDIDPSWLKISASSDVPCDTWEMTTNNGAEWSRLGSTSTTSAAVITGPFKADTTYHIGVRARKTSNGVVGTSEIVAITMPKAVSIDSVSDITVNSSYSATLEVYYSVNGAKKMKISAVTAEGVELLPLESVMLPVSSAVASYTKNLDSSIVASAVNRIPSSVQTTVTVTVTAYDGNDVQMGSPDTASARILLDGSFAPSIDDETVTLYDSNASSVSVTGDSSKYIQSVSNLTVKNFAASAKGGASIVKYEVSCGGKIVESASGVEIIFGTVSSSGSVAVRLSAIDSRGYSKYIDRQIDVSTYSPLSIKTWSASRINSVEESISLHFSGSMSPLVFGGSDKNSITSAKIAWNQVGGSDFGEASISVPYSTGSFSFSADPMQGVSLNPDYSYNLSISVSDVFSSDKEEDIYINTGKPLVSYRKNKVGILTASPQYALDVYGDIARNGVPLPNPFPKVALTGNYYDLINWYASEHVTKYRMYMDPANQHEAKIGEYGSTDYFSRPADAWVRAAFAGGCIIYCEDFAISSHLNQYGSDYENMINSPLYGMWFINCPNQSSSTGQTGNGDFPCTGIAIEILWTSGWVRGWCNAVDYDGGLAEIQGNIKNMGLTLNGWYKVYPRINVTNNGTTWVWYPLDGAS